MLSKLMAEVESHDGQQNIMNSNEILANNSTGNNASINLSQIFHNHSTHGNHPVLFKSETIKTGRPEGMEHIDFEHHPIDLMNLTTRDHINQNHHPSLLCEPQQTPWNNGHMGLLTPFQYENPFENELHTRILDNGKFGTRHFDHDGHFLDFMHSPKHEHFEKHEDFDTRFPDFDEKHDHFRINEPPNFLLPKREISDELLHHNFPQMKCEQSNANNILFPKASLQIETGNEAKDKIDILKTKISSIQSLFLETKNELEKLQKSMNTN
jgi:hypothetical protein